MLHIAIMGFGTVGAGVAEVVRMNAASIAEKTGEEVNVKYILDVRDFPDSPYADKMIKDFAILESDPEVEVVVESIGGAKVALEFTRRALQTGKHVVTSNKELVATHGKELLSIAKARGVNYLFEASVGGGIPVLRPLFEDLSANQIEEIVGILNGTTNYILTRMVKGGVSFADALKEAQSKGYAEADPTADVEGIDAGRKICILSDLAWGKEVLPQSISMEGISAIHLQDVDIAAKAGYRIKLLGRALRLPDGRQTAYVAPHLVPESCPIAVVDDVFNGIMIRGNAVGDVMFYGRGAGDLPTASAVMSDVLDAAAHRQNRRDIGWNESAEVTPAGEIPMKWYLRGSFSSEDAKTLCGEVEVLSSGAVITGALTEAQVKDAAEKLGAAAMLRVL
ncbi:MAG: homoserine dehydrogenase [Oscillospiraceae bacterium]|nr:homoserine dehydrogenase [Oscillospiraceae bacterium]